MRFEFARNPKPRKMIGFLLLLLCVPMSALADPPPGIPDGWSSGYVYANGIRVHYYRAVPAPNRPAIVMVHGISDIGLSWTTLTWKLQDSYDIYMVDTRGHGLSDPFTVGDDRDTLVKDLVAFITAMELEKPILMGHSMGAATVMRLGAEHPDLARAIIMLDPGLGRRAPVAKTETRQGPAATAPSRSSPAAPPAAPAQPSSLDSLVIRMSGPPEVMVAQNNYSFDDLVAKCRQQTPKWDLVDCQYWALSKKQYHGVYSEEVRQAISGGMPAQEALAKITVPALILKADASAEVRAANEEAASVLQNGMLVHIEGGGHNLHHDELERTVEVLTEFLSTL